MADSNEAQTRRALIDPALARAGWDVNNPAQVGLEIPVDGFDPQAWRQQVEADLRESRVAYEVEAPNEQRVLLEK